LIGEGVMLNPPLASLSPLHSAVAIGSVPMIRALIGSGVDCTAKDAYGATALDWAYELDDRGTVLAVLLAAGLRGASFDLRTASCREAGVRRRGAPVATCSRSHWHHATCSRSTPMARRTAAYSPNWGEEIAVRFEMRLSSPSSRCSSAARRCSWDSICSCRSA